MNLNVEHRGLFLPSFTCYALLMTLPNTSFSFIHLLIFPAETQNPAELYMGVGCREGLGAKNRVADDLAFAEWPGTAVSKRDSLKSSDVTFLGLGEAVTCSCHCP